MTLIASSVLINPQPTILLWLAVPALDLREKVTWTVSCHDARWNLTKETYLARGLGIAIPASWKQARKARRPGTARYK